MSTVGHPAVQNSLDCPLCNSSCCYVAADSESYRCDSCGHRFWPYGRVQGVVQNTGGQPAPEAVEQVARESGQVAMPLYDWMLIQPWRLGDCNRVICDPPVGDFIVSGVEFYGGLCVLESCPESVRRHIVDLHNRAIGFPPAAVPSRDAEVA